MLPFEYHKASPGEIEQLGSSFCDEHGDGPHGLIANDEYDRLFDHLADALRRHGTFVEGSGEADFSGYRYVDQIPWITTVPSDTVSPATALLVALEAVSNSHRPFAVSFDFYPDALLILPPSRVFTSFEQSVFTQSV